MARSSAVSRAVDMMGFLAIVRGMASDGVMDVQVGYGTEDGEAHLAWLARMGGQPGDGARFLASVCDVADRMGVSISLMVEGGERKVMAVYEAVGFLTYGEGTDGSSHMWRVPGASVPPYMQGGTDGIHGGMRR